MVEISLSGSGEGPGWETAPGYSTADGVENVLRCSRARARARGQSGRDGILAKDSLSPSSERGSDCFLTRPIL